MHLWVYRCSASGLFLLSYHFFFTSMRVSILVADLFPYLLSKILHNLLRETSISAMTDMPIYRCMYKFSFLFHFLMIFIITMQTISLFSFILHLKENEFVAKKKLQITLFTPTLDTRTKFVIMTI